MTAEMTRPRFGPDEQHLVYLVEDAAPELEAMIASMDVGNLTRQELVFLLQEFVRAEKICIRPNESIVPAGTPTNVRLSYDQRDGAATAYWRVKEGGEARAEVAEASDHVHALFAVCQKGMALAASSPVIALFGYDMRKSSRIVDGDNLSWTHLELHIGFGEMRWKISTEGKTVKDAVLRGFVMAATRAALLIKAPIEDAAVEVASQETRSVATV